MNTRQPQTGGLTIPSGIGVAQSKLDQLISRFATIPTVEQQLHGYGIGMMPKPLVELQQITAEALTTTNNKDYTTMYAQQLAWFNYLAPLLANVEANLLQAENTFTLIEAEIKDGIYEQNKLLEKKDKMSESEVKTKVLVHPTYQDCLLEVQRMKQFKERIDAHAKIASRNMQVISRQVEIRRQEIEGFGRENNMPGRNLGPRPIGR